MSLVCLLSAKHSPGVTTTAVALAAAWPERCALVVECDPAGGDLAALTGLPLEPGLTTMAAAQRHGFTATDFAAHAQQLPAGVDAVVAPPSAEGTRAALGTLAGRLGAGLSATDSTDVLVDCGRFDRASSVTDALLELADLVVVVARPTLAGVEHVASRLERLRHAGEANLGLILIGDRPYPAQEVADYLSSPVLGVIAHDAVAATSLLSATPSPRLARSLLLRSARTVTDSLVVRLTRLSPAGSPAKGPAVDAANSLATTWPGQR